MSESETTPAGSGVLPYAAPAYRADEVKFWSNGLLLDMREDAVLPDRCIKCNAVQSTRAVRKRLSWVDPTYRERYRGFRRIPYLRLFYVISKAISEYQNRRTATVRLPVCRRHRTLGRMRAVLSMALMVIAAGAGYVGYQMNNPTLLFGAFAALVVGGAVWQYWPALAVATRIDHGLVTIRGCGTDFLASLPVGGPAQFSARAAPSDLAVATARLTRRI